MVKQDRQGLLNEWFNGKTKRQYAKTKSAATKRNNMEGGRGGAKLKNASVCDTSENNVCALVVHCRSMECDFVTDVYDEFEWQYWIEEKIGLPECPKCGGRLEKAAQQYRELTS